MGIQVWKPYLLKLLIDSKTLISKVIEVFRLTFSWQEGFNFKTRGTHRFTGTFSLIDHFAFCSRSHCSVSAAVFKYFAARSGFMHV